MNTNTVWDHLFGHLSLWRKIRRGHWEYWEFHYAIPTHWRWMRVPPCSFDLGPWPEKTQSHPIRCEDYTKENRYAHP